MKSKTEVVRSYCQKFRTIPTHALTRLIYKKHRHLFTSYDNLRQSIRHFRGNHGNQHRNEVADKSLVRPPQPAGFSWQFPKSFAPSYEPFDLRERRILVLSDLHIPFHDSNAIHAAIDYAAKRNPTCILLNGDVCDFYSISRFDKNPTESSLKKEVTLTRQFMGWLRQKFPKSRIIYKLGNHDEWFDKYLWRKAPELYEVPGLTLKHLTTEAIGDLPEVGGIEWVDDQQKVTVGKLSIWHGHEIGKGSISPPVNPARGLFMRTLECGLMGHLHKGSVHEETSSNHKLIATWSTGCLCGLWPRYARVNKWGHGAAWVELDNRHNFSVELIRILNGRIL